MASALIDDWVYIDVDGNCGVYGRQEIDRGFKSKIRNISVAFLDYETRFVSLTDQKNAYQEALIHSSFDDNYFVAQERLSTNSLGVIAAKKEAIEEIYSYFSGVPIERLVPYGAAIRAFLKSKGLLDSRQCVIFLDDLKNQTVLTFFEGGYFSNPRRIGLRDAQYMVSEIKRSWQNFIAQHPNQERTAEPSFTLVSNNSEWLSSFIQEGFLSKEQAVHIQASFAVLEGLKNAKFSIHFAPLQDILRKKKRELWAKRFKLWGVCIALIVLGTAAYRTSRIIEEKEQKEYYYLTEKKGFLEAKLEKSYQKKFLSFLFQNKTLDYARIYYDFLQLIPAGYLIDSVRFQKEAQDAWSFQGEIYPQEPYASQEPFKRQLSFSTADTTSHILNKVLGERIVLKLNSKARQP